ncbi:MAG: hypothetical protein NTV97_23705 [Alphaproteobacteria bacterium]|nr:hypothetical protein [Alphaproteobacteria bacterium]
MIPSSPAHWTQRYLGMPYEPGGCLLLFVRVQRERFGRIVDPVAIPGALRERILAFSAAPETVGWARVARPIDGDAVLMSFHARPHHIGVYVADVARGSVLQSIEGSGVVLPSLASQAAGFWRVLGFYRPQAEIAADAVAREAA